MDLGIPRFNRRASKEAGKLSAVGEPIARSVGAGIAEDEVLGHAVVKLSPEELLVKEKRVHQEVEHAAAGPDAARRQRPPSKQRGWTPSTAAASASFNSSRNFLCKVSGRGSRTVLRTKRSVLHLRVGRVSESLFRI